MISDEEVIEALEKMKNDIEFTMIRNDLDRWSYHIYIYCKSDIGLTYASHLMKMMNVRTNFVSLIPSTYKKGPFDCFKVVELFHELYHSDYINTSDISILESVTMEDDDFHILITKDSIENSEKNITMGYRSFHEYFE